MNQLSDDTNAPEWMYDGEPWAELAKQAGFEPYHTESSARRAFEYCADLNEALQNKNSNLTRVLEDVETGLEAILATDYSASKLEQVLITIREGLQA